MSSIIKGITDENLLKTYGDQWGLDENYAQATLDFFKDLSGGYGAAQLNKAIVYYLQGRHQEGAQFLSSTLKGVKPEVAAKIKAQLEKLPKVAVDPNNDAVAQKYIENTVMPWIKKQIEQSLKEGNLPPRAGFNKKPVQKGPGTSKDDYEYTEFTPRGKEDREAWAVKRTVDKQKLAPKQPKSLDTGFYSNYLGKRPFREGSLSEALDQIYQQRDGFSDEDKVLFHYLKSPMFKSNAQGEDWIYAAQDWLETVKKDLQKKYPNLDLSDLNDFAHRMYEDYLARMGKLEEGKVKQGEPTDNFTIDDIHELEKIKDFDKLKAKAKWLIKGKPARRMKQEKIAYFYDRVDTLTSPMKVIKMMYDLLLAGEGHKTIGSWHSMDPNHYAKAFSKLEETHSTGTTIGSAGIGGGSGIGVEASPIVQAFQNQIDEGEVISLQARKIAKQLPIVYATGRLGTVNDVDLIFKDLRTNKIVAHVIGRNDRPVEINGKKLGGPIYEIRINNQGLKSDGGPPSYVAMGNPNSDDDKGQYRIFTLKPSDKKIEKSPGPGGTTKLRPDRDDVMKYMVTSGTYYGNDLIPESDEDWYTFLQKALNGKIMEQELAVELGYVYQYYNGELVFLQQPQTISGEEIKIPQDDWEKQGIESPYEPRTPNLKYFNLDDIKETIQSSQGGMGQAYRKISVKGPAGIKETAIPMFTPEDELTELKHDTIDSYISRQSALARGGAKEPAKKFGNVKVPAWKVAAAKIAKPDSEMSKYAKVKATPESAIMKGLQAEGETTGKTEWSKANPPPPDLLLNTLIQILMRPDNKSSPEDLINLWNQKYGLKHTLRTLRAYAQNDYKKAELSKALTQAAMLSEKWSSKYKKSINCSNPKGFSQKAHCAGRKARQAGKHTKSKSVS